MIDGQQRITQHKRLVPYSIHSNSVIDATSFMLVILCGILMKSYETSLV